MNNPNTLNPAVLTETLSVRLPLEFIKALIAAEGFPQAVRRLMKSAGRQAAAA
jgi:hypothetical protein